MAFTEEEIAAARQRGHETSPVAVEVRYSRTKEALTVVYDNGIVISTPVALFQELHELEQWPTQPQLSNVKIWGAGTAVHFPDIDVTIWAPGLLAGIHGSRAWMSELARAGGSVRSPAKAAASRANGTKGGRPRKAPAEPEPA